MTTISNTITNGIELGITYPSPLTITTTGYINAGNSGYHGAAVYGAAASSLTLTNQGRISITQVGAVGIEDATNTGFTINNSGTVSAEYGGGIYLTHQGPLANSGTIFSNDNIGVVATNGGVQITNTGTGLISGYADGLYLKNGGTVSNSGTITGTGFHGAGIRIRNGAATVSNSGSD
jgi:fibronectin-binding autotransporter adhesin